MITSAERDGSIEADFLDPRKGMVFGLVTGIRSDRVKSHVVVLEDEDVLSQ